MTDLFPTSGSTSVDQYQATVSGECLNYVDKAVAELRVAAGECDPLAVLEHVCIGLSFIGSASRLFPNIVWIFSDGEHVSTSLIFPLTTTVCEIVGSRLPHEDVFTGMGTASNLLCNVDDGLHYDRQLQIGLLQADLAALCLRRMIAARGNHLYRFLAARQAWDAPPIADPIQ